MNLSAETATVLFAIRHRLSLWRERLRQVRRLPPDSLELALAVVNVLIGLRLLWPNALTLSGRAAPVMIHVLPLPLWPLILLPCGVLTWVGYLDNVTVVRRASALTLCAFWAVTGAVMLVRLWGSYGPLFNVAFAFCEMWLFWGLGVYEVKSKYRALRSTARPVEVSDITLPDLAKLPSL